ncbi:hypothetical protein CDAR_591481 [Caerostris darwini]|uniref:Uncharacterized protein n=1 Tax=Caerostris darwini TaxID=1538125 RepID=A0AAV4PLH8_9ARAC|nr:hypothetical protein CDAR_591481 [Caerostris darwini]
MAYGLEKLGRPSAANGKRVVRVRASGSHGTSGRTEQQRVRLGPCAQYTFPSALQKACLYEFGISWNSPCRWAIEDNSYMSLRDLDTGPSNCEDVASEATAPSSSRHPAPTQQSSRARCLGVDAY